MKKFLKVHMVKRAGERPFSGSGVQRRDEKISF
jgi:hypothetical protein